MYLLTYLLFAAAAFYFNKTLTPALLRNIRTAAS